MSLAYMLDTNVVSEPLRPEPNKKVLAKLQRSKGQLCVSSLVWHELLFGCYRLPDSSKRSVIEQYLRNVISVSLPILPYEERAANWHAQERARLTKAGKTPSFVDGQIAAIAKVNDLILVTFNIADFQHFKDLSVQDWRA